jgi:hypothetical protein
MKNLFNKIFSNNSESGISDEVYSQNLKIAIDAINKYWTNNNIATKGKYDEQLSEERIQKLAELLLTDCVHILTHQNPFLENRRYLVDSIILFSKLQVLILKNNPNDDTTGFLGHLGISGELNSRLVEAVKSDPILSSNFKHLKSFNYENVYSQCLYEYRYEYSRMLVFSHLRVVFNDLNFEKDWLRPSIVSSCAWEEHSFRKKLKMKVSEGIDSLKYLKYSTYMNHVMNGEKDPRKSWNELNSDIESPDDI